jgi:hypothetical protein
MPALKYWNGSAWVNLTGAPSSPNYRRTVYAVSDNASGGGVNLTATAFGTHFGPAVNAYIGTMGAKVDFYCQVGLQTSAPGSDLIVGVQVLTYPGGAEVQGPLDNNCLYVAPPAAGYNGPGHVAGFFFVNVPSLANYTVQIHYRVSVGTTNVMRRRLAVTPMELIAS